LRTGDVNQDLKLTCARDHQDSNTVYVVNLSLGKTTGKEQTACKASSKRQSDPRWQSRQTGLSTKYEKQGYALVHSNHRSIRRAQLDACFLLRWITGPGLLEAVPKRVGSQGQHRFGTRQEMSEGKRFGSVPGVMVVQRWFRILQREKAKAGEALRGEVRRQEKWMGSQGLWMTCG
jgi:hypothetical protein